MEISANRLDDLCALAFFEEVDRLVGKGHLFKRSVLLIKACPSAPFDTHLLTLDGVLIRRLYIFSARNTHATSLIVNVRS